MNLHWIFRHRDNPLALVSTPKPNKENKNPRLSLKERSLPKQNLVLHQLKPSIHFPSLQSISNLVAKYLEGKDIQPQTFLKHYHDKVCINIQTMRTASNTEGTKKCCECIGMKRDKSQKLDKTKTSSQIFHKEKNPLSLNKPSNTQPQKTKALPDLNLSSQTLTLQLVSKLKLRNIVFQQESDNYSIKKKGLEDVLNFVLKIMSTQQTAPVLQKYGEYSCFLDTIKKLYEMGKSNRKKESTLKLSLLSKTVNVEVNHQLFANETEHCQERIQTAKRDIQILNQQNQKSENKLSALRAKFDLKVNESTILTKQLREAQQDMKKHSLNLRSIKRKLEEELAKLGRTKDLEKELNLQLSEILKKKKANQRHVKEQQGEKQQNSENRQM